MTDFVSYTAAEYAPDAPATALHFQRWFQNWEAGFQGAAGAQRLLAGAFPDFAAGNVEIINFIMPAGAVKSATRSSGSNGQSTGPAYGLGGQMIKAGSLRLSVDLRKAGSYTGGSDGFLLFKNGTQIASISATTTWTTYTADFSFAANDEITGAITVSSTTSLSGQTEYRNLRLLGNQRGLFRL